MRWNGWVLGGVGWGRLSHRTAAIHEFCQIVHDSICQPAVEATSLSCSWIIVDLKSSIWRQSFRGRGRPKTHTPPQVRLPQTYTLDPTPLILVLVCLLYCWRRRWSRHKKVLLSTNSLLKGRARARAIEMWGNTFDFQPINQNLYKIYFKSLAFRWEGRRARTTLWGSTLTTILLSQGVKREKLLRSDEEDDDDNEDDDGDDDHDDNEDFLQGDNWQMPSDSVKGRQLGRQVGWWWWMIYDDDDEDDDDYEWGGCG